MPHLRRERHPERGVIVKFCKDCYKQYEEEMAEIISALETFIEGKDWYVGTVPSAMLVAFAIALVTQGASNGEDVGLCQ